MGVVYLAWVIKFFKQFLKTKTAYYIISVILGIVIFGFVMEVGLNFWVRSGLRENLAKESGPEFWINSKISWMGLDDIFFGKVNRIWVNVRNCSLNDLRYSELIIDSRGFRFNLPLLLKKRQLEITDIEKTRINGVIAEPSLNDYLNLRYPEYQSNLKIKPGGLILSGTARILNKIIPVVLEGDLRTISEKKLRFYPTRLLIAQNSISGSLLKIVSEQVPLEFGVMEDWPLAITDFKLADHKIEITMEEFKTSGR